MSFCLKLSDHGQQLVAEKILASYRAFITSKSMECSILLCRKSGLNDTRFSGKKMLYLKQYLKFLPNHFIN
jgi:hypothetical protein